MTAEERLAEAAAWLNDHWPWRNVFSDQESADYFRGGNDAAEYVVAKMRLLLDLPTSYPIEDDRDRT